MSSPSVSRSDFARTGPATSTASSRETPDDAGRRVGNRRESPAQLDEGQILDLSDEPAHDVVEHRDLLFGEIPGVVDEESSDTLQYFHPPIGGTGPQRALKLVDDSW